MLSVLIVAPRLESRGSSSYAMRLFRHLPSNGIQLHVVSPDPFPATLRSIPDLRWTCLPQLTRPVLGRLVLALLIRDLRDQPPQLIHAPTRNTLSQATAIGRALRVPVIVTAHDHTIPGHRLRVDRRVVQRIVAVSESIKTDLLRHTRLPESFVEVIVGGVESTHSVVPVVPFDPGHIPVVGTAGPLESVKGIPYFLGAAQRILTSGRAIEFLVAGSGPEEANLRRLARELGIGARVTFVPYILDFTETLAAMDLFVLPSLRQGLGTVMLEAMSLARPVIATGVGGVYSIVRDRETGLVIPPSQSEPLARGILELASDPQLARRLGENAQALVRDQFSAQRMINETVALYREVAECTVPA